MPRIAVLLTRVIGASYIAPPVDVVVEGTVLIVDNQLVSNPPVNVKIASDLAN